MNKVDSNASLETIADMILPFLKSLAAIENAALKERIIERVFNPLLENNKTIVDPSDDEEEMAKKEHYHRHVDGGKMNPRT